MPGRLRGRSGSRLEIFLRPSAAADPRAPAFGAASGRSVSVNPAPVHPRLRGWFHPPPSGVEVDSGSFQAYRGPRIARAVDPRVRGVGQQNRFIPVSAAVRPGGLVGHRARLSTDGQSCPTPETVDPRFCGALALRAADLRVCGDPPPPGLGPDGGLGVPRSVRLRLILAGAAVSQVSNLLRYILPRFPVLAYSRSRAVSFRPPQGNNAGLSPRMRGLARAFKARSNVAVALLFYPLPSVRSRPPLYADTG